MLKREGNMGDWKSGGAYEIGCIGDGGDICIVIGSAGAGPAANGGGGAGCGGD